MTTRMKVDQDLTASPEQYRGLFEHMREGFAYCKMIYEAGKPSDFIYLEVNRAFEKLTGLTRVRGRFVSKVIPGIRASNPELFEIYGRVASTGKPEKFETHLDALGIWFSISVYSPKPEHFVAVFENITERKQTEEALRESEKRFNIIYNKIPIPGVLSRSNDGIIVDVNEAFERVFGFTREEAVGKTSLELGINPDTEGRERIMAALQARGSVQEIELKLYTKARDSRVFLVNIDIVDIHGQKYILQTAQDITERKQTEARITNLLLFNEKILNTAPVGIITYQMTGECIFANEKAARIVGTTVEKLTAQNFRTLESWKKSGLYQLAEKAIASEDPVMADIHIITTFGKDKWLTVRAVTFKSKAETQLLLTFSDITERKQVEEALAKEQYLLYALLDAVPDYIYFKDTKSRFIRTSKAHSKAFGLSDPALVIGKSDFDFFTGEHARQAYEDEQEIIRTGQPISKEEKETWADRPDTWVLTTKMPLCDQQGKIIGTFGISKDISERKQAEAAQLNYTAFLESLNHIIRIVLGAQDLESTLQVLVEKIATLFGADDCFLSLWDEVNEKPIPMVAYGSMKDTFSQLVFDAGEHTLAASLMKAGYPLVIPDTRNSPYLSLRVASLFSSSTMLGLPLIVQDRKIAILYLGYNQSRTFRRNEIDQAEIAAQQIALVLTKRQLFEDAQRLVKQLTVLNEIASVATEVDTIDRLIEHTTKIIGSSLFPDNFGILVMDEDKGLLHPHPSYQFTSNNNSLAADMPIGQGITGKVAETGQPIRIGNIESAQNYVDIDQSTFSELCVPIKLKDRVLGVINAENTRADAFSLDDELLLGTIAGQLATAIERIRTVEAERQWFHQLAHSNGLINVLAQITTYMEKALTQQEIMQTLGKKLREIDLTCTAAIFDNDRKLFTISYTSIDQKVLEKVEDAIGFPFEKHTFFLKRLHPILTKEGSLEPAIITNPEDEIKLLFSLNERKSIREILRGLGLRSEVEYLRLPLVVEENILGILWVWGKGIMKSDLPIMSTFAKQIATSLERARLFQEVQGLALTDPLTGVQNRRGLFELGKIEFARSKRMFRPFCCMMLDIDHFKHINDTYGHPIGDLVLQELAQCAKKGIREVDLIGRYGGEEFLIFLPETDLNTGLRVAERLRASIEKMPIKVSDQELHITVSIGVSRKDENTLELETLIARADQALYIAKYKGRNQVISSK